MQAAYIKGHGGADVVELGDLPKPELGVGEVRVRIHAASLNHLDIWVRKGLPTLKLNYPHILGGDGAGVVEHPDGTSAESVIVHPGLSCGKCKHCVSGIESLCTDYQILGEHVSGTHAEYVKVPRANVFPIPSGLSFQEAASIPLVFTTAWQMLTHAKLEAGDRVLIHAAGSGVSSAAIQIAALFRAEVIATAGSDEKCELAKSLGAVHTINYRTKDFLEEVRSLTGKRGVDVILDHVGQEIWDNNIRAIKSGGKIIICGASSGPRAQTNLGHVFYRQIQIIGSTMGSKRDFPKILEHFSQGRLRAVVSRCFALAEAADAHRFLESRRQFGKVILEMPPA